jgi:hypothetical protein
MLTGTQGAALGVQRAKRARLNIVLGRLAKPNANPTERAAREVYRLRLPERMPLRSYTLTGCDTGHATLMRGQVKREPYAEPWESNAGCSREAKH